MTVIEEHAGWEGAFTTDQAEHALPNGSRVEKAAGEPGDAHPIGSLATVLGSVSHPSVGMAYFVEWDDMPRHAVGVSAWKLRPAP